MRTRRLLRPLIALMAIGLLAAATALGEGMTTVRAGNLVLRVGGGVSPKRLPRHRLAPITLHMAGRLSTTDGSQPPATKTVTIDFDKHGTVNARGLPVCRAGKLEARNTSAAKAACRKAIVGTGSTTVRVAFPESQPFYATGPLVLFNGGMRGRITTMFIHAYVSVPAPTAIVTTVKIRKIHKGPFGTRATARIPKIAGGAGSLVRFQLKIHRLFRRSGRRQSYLLARCATGHFLAHAVLDSVGGPRLVGNVARPCRAGR